MIAAASPDAARAGLQMLRRHGSAVDAAIAAQMVLALVEPESSGLGGGGFLLLWSPRTHRMVSFDGRETAPASATPGMFLDANGKPKSKFDVIPGGLSVGVPGELAMLARAHKEYGRLPWKVLFQPAIRLARQGFRVKEKLAATLRQYPQMAAMPDIKAYFYKRDGTPYAAGEILKNPALARTLEEIAARGPDAFYRGRIARDIVQRVQHAPVNPASMTVDDLRRYTAVERDAVCGPYRTYKVCAMGPPSSGGIAVIQMLTMLERFAPSELDPTSLEGVHLFTQASRLAFADRAQYLGDPAFVAVPVKGLLDARYLAQRAALIDPAKDMGKAASGQPEGAAFFAPQTSPEHPGTSHMAVVDDTGEVVSMTSTVEAPLGSEMMVDGFILNNELTDFSLDPMRDGKPVADAAAPGKRPLSSMAPTIVLDATGRFRLATGSPGGAMIVDYVAQSLVAMLDTGMTPQAAVALPHPGNLNGATFLEKGTALEALAPQLTAMGHTVAAPAVEKSGLHVIERVSGVYVGAADPRRDGVVLGD
ncbi:MAG: gamma-glutamyltransferase [Alphaproteobacteria bacterium]|nr:gamma-glutamyltransferase [Alphaproteobacteria bacterium]MBV9694285.1 gamma-glutamyltransferase [Alphaproteobacteria bacterium]